MKDFPRQQWIKKQDEYRGYRYVVCCEPGPKNQPWWVVYVAPEDSHEWQRSSVVAGDLEDGVRLCCELINYKYVIAEWEEQRGCKYDAIKHGSLRRCGRTGEVVARREPEQWTHRESPVEPGWFWRLWSRITCRKQPKS